MVHKASRLLLAIVAMVAVVVFAAPAQAQLDDDIVDITFGEYALGVDNAVLLDVALESGRTVEGELRVEAQSASGSNFSYPVSISAGETYRQVVSVGSAFSNINVTFVFVQDGEVLGEETFVGNRSSEVAVATLGLEKQTTTSSVTLNRTVDEVTFDSSLARADGYEGFLFALDNFTTLTSFQVLVAEPSAVRSLSDSDVQQLVSWISAGGSLQITGEVSSVDVLPEAWRSGTSQAGQGSVSFIGTNWQDSITYLDPVFLQDNLRSSTSIFDEANISIPPLGWLTLGLLFYIIFIGPVCFFVLKRKGKQFLLWLIIPAVSVIATGSILVIGKSLMSSRNTAHISLVEVTPSGSYITSQTLTLEDELTLKAPPGWKPYLQQNSYDTYDSENFPTMKLDSTSTEVSFDLASGNAANMMMQGSSADYSEALVIEIESIDRQNVEGTITNNSGHTLKESKIFLGGDSMSLGTLEQGETSFSESYRVSGNEVFGSFNTSDEDIVDAAFWQSVVNKRPLKGSVLTAVGWTDEATSPLGIKNGKTAFLARTPVTDASLDLQYQVRDVDPSDFARDSYYEDYGYTQTTVDYYYDETTIGESEMTVDDDFFTTVDGEDSETTAALDSGSMEDAPTTTSDLFTGTTIETPAVTIEIVDAASLEGEQ